MRECPCCGRLRVGDDNICGHCGVGVAWGSTSDVPLRRTRPQYHEDQDRINPYTDYARTRQDHSRDE